MKPRILMLLSIVLLLISIMGCNNDITTATISNTETTITSTITSASSTMTTTTTETTEPVTYSLTELQADYDQFVGYIQYNPQIFTDKVELADVIASQRELLYEGMTQLEFYRVLAVVNATIRCGHTNVRVPDSIVSEVFNSNTYSVDVRLIDNQLVVIEVIGTTDLEFGDVIISINGQNVSDLTLEMMRYLSADGEGLSLKTRVLSTYYFSYYNLFLGSNEALEIEYIDDTSGATNSELLLRNGPENPAYEEEPAFEAQYEADYAIMTLRTFYPYGVYSITSFYTFFDTFFNQIDTLGIDKIILDLRGNGGGDPRVASRLISYFASAPQPYFAESSPDYYSGLKSVVPLSEPHFDGTLLVLIDAFCFSTCGHFVALLSYHSIGTLIGEETNGGYICSDSSVEYRLRNTRITFRSSKTAWSVAVEGLPYGRGTSPDVDVAMTLEDYRLGIDRVLQTAIDQFMN